MSRNVCAHARASSRVTYLDSCSTWMVVSLTAALCYVVPKLAGALISNPQTVWPLWPGCAILASMLLMVRRAIWPLLIPAGLAGFAIYDLQAGVPIHSLAWFISSAPVPV